MFRQAGRRPTTMPRAARYAISVKKPRHFFVHRLMCLVCQELTEDILTTFTTEHIYAYKDALIAEISSTMKKKDTKLQLKSKELEASSTVLLIRVLSGVPLSLHSTLPIHLLSLCILYCLSSVSVFSCSFCLVLLPLTLTSQSLTCGLSRMHTGVCLFFVIAFPAALFWVHRSAGRQG